MLCKSFSLTKLAEARRNVLMTQVVSAERIVQRGRFVRSIKVSKCLARRSGMWIQTVHGLCALEVMAFGGCLYEDLNPQIVLRPLQ